MPKIDFLLTIFLKRFIKWMTESILFYYVWKFCQVLSDYKDRLCKS